mmetsp:Transcript_42952/g.96667  ORF Transcript_42952/g.96667 Transcript_42952/m.96667 type:complete len:204 (-) Transcript_42952:2683-3294(-)
MVVGILMFSTSRSASSSPTPLVPSSTKVSSSSTVTLCAPLSTAAHAASTTPWIVAVTPVVNPCAAAVTRTGTVASTAVGRTTPPVVTRTLLSWSILKPDTGSMVVRPEKTVKVWLRSVPADRVSVATPMTSRAAPSCEGISAQALRSQGWDSQRHTRYRPASASSRVTWFHPASSSFRESAVRCSMGSPSTFTRSSPSNAQEP